MRDARGSRLILWKVNLRGDRRAAEKICRGTDGSNLSPSSSESANFRFRCGHDGFSRALAMPSQSVIRLNPEFRRPEMALQMDQPLTSNLRRVRRCRSHAAVSLRREIAQPRKTSSYRGGGSPPSHPSCAGWRRRIRHGSSIGSDPLDAMHDARTCAMAATRQAKMAVILSRWRFF